MRRKFNIKLTIYQFGFWFIYFIFVDIEMEFMSQEVLEISVMVDEQFDVNFNLADGILGVILSIFEG